MNLKKSALILIAVVNLLLTGCADSKEINTLAIAIGMGLDKTENGYLITSQVLNPRAIAAKSPVQESPVKLYKVPVEDLFNASMQMDSISSKRMYYSHLRVVVLGEALAREGIRELLDSFVRDNEFRYDFFFIIAKGTTAYEILSTITPLETVSGMGIYKLLRNSEKMWTPVYAVKLPTLADALIVEGKDPALTGAELIEKESQSDSFDILKKSSSTKIMLSEIGAFKGDKIAGWLDENESRGYNYIGGNVKNAGDYVSYSEDSRIKYNVVKSKSRVKAYLAEGKPAIKVKYNISAESEGFDASIDENAANLINWLKDI